MAKTVGIEEIRAAMAGEGHEALSKVAIGQFVADGMPKEARNRYDLEKCLVWYVGRLRTANQQRAKEGEDGKVVRLDEAQRRLTLAKAENEEMTAKERRGELIPMPMYVAEMAKLITVTKQKVLNIPARVAPKLVGLSRGAIKAELADTVKAALSDLSQAHDATGTSTARDRARA